MGPLVMENTHNFKHQSTPRISQPTTIADDTERLTRKPGKQNVMVWYVTGFDLDKTALALDSVAALILYPALFIYIASKNALKTECGGGIVEAADPAELVRECVDVRSLQLLGDYRFQKRRNGLLQPLHAINSA